MKHEFIASVKNGKLSNRSILIKCINHFEGKKIRLTIEKYSSKRTHPQNSYIHVLFTIFTDALNDLGNEFLMTEVKELCKAKFLLTDVMNEKTGEIIGQRIKGTSELTKTELNEFFEKVIRWAADSFGIILPYPDEQLEIE